jgi:hypothetical protein
MADRNYLGYRGSNAKTLDHLHIIDNQFTTVLRDSDTSGAVLGTSSGGIFTLLNGVAVGSGVDQRTGRAILAHQMKCRWQIVNTQVEAVTPMTCLVAIIKDTQPGTVPPSYTDVWDASGAMTSSANTHHPLSFMNVDNSGRFQVLYRKIVYLGGSSNLSTDDTDKNISGFTTSGDIAHDDVYLTLDKKIRYDGPGAGDADIFDCAYYMVTCPYYHRNSSGIPNSLPPDNTTPGGPKWEFQCITRFTYKDL